MAVTDAYSDASTYRAVTDKTDTAEDAEILTDLTAVSRYLEQRLGRFFNKDASDVARDFIAPYDGPVFPEAENPYKYSRGSRMLHIDDLSAAPTSIVVDSNGDGTPETTLASTDYQLMPLNADKGAEPRPYTSIYIPVWSTQLGWPPQRIVRVTGKWGWPAVPEAIKRATIHITAILRLETPRAQATVSELGQLVQSSSQARGIIDDLTRHYVRLSL